MAHQNVKPKPKLPVQQLSILAVARFAEPMAYTSVNPYLPEMIAGFGVEQNKVARWAGLTSAVFSLAQSATAVPWGKAADRYGRKPVLIFGLLSTMITFVIWGLSTSLPMAVTVRAIQGGGNGNVGIIRTMVAEMVTEKELQPRAFSVMPLVWSLGSIVGPSFGGFFADPVKQYPALFGDSRLFTAFPYLLPNLVATIFFTISVFSAVFFLEETLSSKRGRGDWGLSAGKRFTRAFRRRRRHNPLDDASSCHRRTSFVDGEATAPLLPGVAPVKDVKPKETVSASMSEVFSRQTVINLAAYTFLAFHSVAFDQNISVFLNYPVRQSTPDNTKLPFYFSGGFGLRSGEIGTIFAMYGIACGLIQFLLYPWLVTRFGVLHCMRICSIALPIVYFLTPYTALFETPTGRYIALGIVMLFKGFGVIIAFPSTTILLTNSASSLRILGTLNGFATMFSGLGRAFGPALTGLAFTWGADHGYILTPYAFLSAIAVLGAIPVFMIVEGDGPGAASAGDSTTDESDNDLLPDESAVIDEEDEEYEAEQAPLLNGNGRGPKYNSIK